MFGIRFFSFSERDKTLAKMFQDGRCVAAAPGEDSLNGGQSRWQCAKDQTRTPDFAKRCRGGRDAEAGGDQPHFGLDIIGILDWTRLGAGLGAFGKKGVVISVLRAGVD